MKNRLTIIIIILSLLLALSLAVSGWLGVTQYKTISESRGNYDAMAALTEEQKVEIEILSAKIDGLTLENEALFESEAQAAAAAEALKAELETTLAGLDELSLKLEELSADNDEKTAALEELKSDAELLEAAISILNGELDSRDARIAALEEELRIKNSRMEYLESSAAGAFQNIRLAYLLLSEELGLDPVLGLTMQDTDAEATAAEPVRTTPAMPNN